MPLITGGVGTRNIPTDALALVPVADVLAYLVVWDGSQWVRVRQVASTAGGNVGYAGVPLLNPGLRISDANVRGLGAAVLSGDGAGGNETADFAPREFEGGAGVWDRRRNVSRVAYLTSAARSGDTNGADRINYNFRGLVVFFNVTAVGAPAAAVTVRVQVKDQTSANYVSIASAAVAVSTTGQRGYLIWPKAAANAGWTEHIDSALGGRTYRVQMDHANEGPDSATYSVDLIEIP